MFTRDYGFDFSSSQWREISGIERRGGGLSRVAMNQIITRLVRVVEIPTSLSLLARPNMYSTIPTQSSRAISPPERLPDMAPAFREDVYFDLRGESARDQHKYLAYL